MENKNINELDLQKAMESMEEITTPKAVKPEIVEDGEYNGPGLVIDSAQLNKPEEPSRANIVNGISPDTEDNFLKTIKEMDAKIELEKEILSTIEKKPDAVITEDDGVIAQPDYQEVTLLLDKMGVGTVVFSEEEKAKLEKSKVIKLKEVELVDIPLKIKKAPNKQRFGELIKKTISFNTTSIVLPYSGYTAVVKGCSPYEIMSLGAPAQSPMERNNTRWSLIHSKIVSTSIGDLSYNDFLSNTSYLDDSVFIYGIICATFADIDTLSIPCSNSECEGIIEVEYQPKSLLRSDLLDSRTIDVITDIIDNSYNLESAKKSHLESEVNTKKMIRVPDSDIYVNIKSKNVYDFINNMLMDIRERSEAKYREVSFISTMIDSIYIPDPDDVESYFEITDGVDIIDLLFQLSSKDIMAISHFASERSNINFRFAIDNVKCPICGTHDIIRDIDLDLLLFMLNQQAMEVPVE